MARNGKLWAFVGLHNGDTSICMADGAADIPWDLAEIAETMAMEACNAEDLPRRSVIYPYKTIRRIESEAVRISIL
jgi:hypothetical protein